MKPEEEKENYLGNTDVFNLDTLIRAQKTIKEEEGVILPLHKVEERLRNKKGDKKNGRHRYNEYCLRAFECMERRRNRRVCAESTNRRYNTRGFGEGNGIIRRRKEGKLR